MALLVVKARAVSRGLAVVLATGMCVVGACRQPARPNVLLVVLDTLRADRLGTYGNTRGLTPFLDELAAQGTVFLRAYSTTSYTDPAVASLFTSRYPSQHRVTSGMKLARADVTLAEQLEQHGYARAGFTANFLLSESRGYAQGFQHWGVLQVKNRRAGPKVRAQDVRVSAARWLTESVPGAGAPPTFLYLHYIDAHAPYTPPLSYRKRFQQPPPEHSNVGLNVRQLETSNPGPAAAKELESLYDGEVAALDTQLRMTFRMLARRGFLEDAIVIVTADHGEAFNAHGVMGHGLALYEELVHVPLIIVAPGFSAGVVRENVSLVDIAPTVLDLIGIDLPASFEGTSLVPLLAAQPTVLTRLADWFGISSRMRTAASEERAVDASTVLIELESNNATFDLRRHSAGIVRGSSKLLLDAAGGSASYDLAADPGEMNPSQVSDETATTLLAVLKARRSDLQSRAVKEVERGLLDEATKERVRALGYDP